MSLAALMSQPVEILTPGTQGGYGDDVVKDWDSASSVSTVAWIAQRKASEIAGFREAGVSEWIGYFPADTAVSIHDRVLRGDDTFEVVGEPNPCYRPSGLHHLEVDLQLVTG